MGIPDPDILSEKLQDMNLAIRLQTREQQGMLQAG